MALAAMRRHRRWLYGFLWIVILAFVILYVPALTDRGQGTPAETLVNVGGLPVSLGEYQRAYNRQQQYYSQLYQGRLDENMIRQLGLEGQVLETLVSERLVELEAKRLGIARVGRGGGARDRDAPRTSRTTASSSARTRSGAGSSSPA